jgi:hypothetical protein
LICLSRFLLKFDMPRTKRRRENQNTHFVFSNFFPENRAVYGVMWKNIVDPDRSQTAICLMHITCWTLKSTNTHSEYVILIAFPLHYWLHERASVVRYAYIACLATVETFKNPNVFISNWKWTHTSSKHSLCLSQHSQPPHVLGRNTTVYDQSYQCVQWFRWRVLWASAVNCDDKQPKLTSN